MHGGFLKSKPAPLVLVLLAFAILVAAAALLLWPGRLGGPTILIASQGRCTNSAGKVLFKVAVTNNSHDSIDFIVARYQAFKFIVSGWTTNAMSMTNFNLKPEAGAEGVVDAPWGVTNTYIAVLYRRERGRRELSLRSLGFRYGLVKVYANWEELWRFDLN